MRFLRWGISDLFKTATIPNPQSRGPQCATKYQKTENRSQIFRLEIVLLNAPCSIPYALCPMPYALCPMPFPATRNSHLATRNPHPATRNPYPASRNPQPVPRIPHPVTRNTATWSSSISPSALPCLSVSAIQRS